MCFLVEASEYDVAISQGIKPFGVCLCGREKLVKKVKEIMAIIHKQGGRSSKRLQRELTEAKVQLEANVGVLFRWEDVRYQLEKSRGMVITELFAFQQACEQNKRFPGAENAESSILAQALTPGQKRLRRNFFPLSDETDLTALQDKIIVWQRHPNLKDPERNRIAKNTYIPEAFVGDADMIEQECFQRAIAAENNIIIKKINETWLCPRVPGTLKYVYSDEPFRLVMIQEVIALQSNRQRTKQNTARVLELFQDYATAPSKEILDSIREIPFEPVQQLQLRFRRATKHPSVNIIEKHYPGFLDKQGKPVKWSDYTKPPPPPNYICKSCWNYFEPFHHCEDCPGRQRKNWVWMSKRPQPHGLFGLVKVSPHSPVEIVEAARWIKGEDLLIEPELLLKLQQKLQVHHQD